MYRVIIVEDDPEIARSTKQFVGKWPELQVKSIFSRFAESVAEELPESDLLSSLSPVPSETETSADEEAPISAVLFLLEHPVPATHISIAVAII